MTNTTTPPNAFTAWLMRLSKAQPHELRAAMLSFAYFFCILAAYYVIRPIREEMAIQVGQSALQELFTAVFLVLLAVVPVFGWITSNFARVKFLPWMYIFFALNLVGFWWWMTFGMGHPAPGAKEAVAVGSSAYWLPRVFYVWVSVFNLFVVSVFWSFMADIFKSDQAKRIYGFIAAGGTAGALAGPILTSSLVKLFGTANMLWFSVGFMLLCIYFLHLLSNWTKAYGELDPKAALNNSEKLNEGVGGNPFAGLTDVFKSPYLLGICLFLFCYALVSTFLYFQQNELMRATFPDSVRRVQVFAMVDGAVHALALVIQLFAFGALIQKLGTTKMLAAMPLLSVLGFIAMALAPVITTLFVFGVLRRAGEYSITKPARETLFNVLPDEQKYKAKNVIDTLVHRTGDVSSGWIFKGLKSMGFDFTAMSWLAVPVSLVWLACAIALGKGNEKRQRGEL
jgi:ATP:ADP antiporter, AAA family